MHNLVTSLYCHRIKLCRSIKAVSSVFLTVTNSCIPVGLYAYRNGYNIIIFMCSFAEELQTNSDTKYIQHISQM